jgi:hypothetical protein
MTDHAPVRSEFPKTQSPDNRFMSTRLIVVLTLLLGAAFTASALVEPSPRSAGGQMQFVAAGETADRPAVADPSAVEDPTVTAAVTHWTAETMTTDRPSQGTYDWQELWLPQ